MIGGWSDVSSGWFFRSGVGAVGSVKTKLGVVLLAGWYLLLALAFFALRSVDVRAEEPSVSDVPELCETQSLSTLVASASSKPATGRSSTLSRSPAQFRAVDLVVVSSGDFTAGRSDAEVVRNIQSTLDIANRYYLPIGLYLRLAGVQIYQQGDSDPYAVAAKQHNARQMLETLRAEWASRQSPAHAVVAVFGKSTFGATYGLAFPGTACLQPQFALLFASQAGDGEAAELSFGATVAHEIGHTLGMDHDSTQYADGPSLMWPLFALNINGFSQFSTNQFLDFEKRGGSACLPTVDVADVPDQSGAGQVLAFAGGSAQQVSINEGERLLRSFAVTGSFPGISYSATGLPPGATFDAATGLLDYTPGFNAGPATFSIHVKADTFSQQAELQIQLSVRDVNQVPSFTSPGFSELRIEEGDVVDFVASAVDADPADKVQAALANKKSVSRFPGKPVVRKVSRSSQSVHWATVPGSAGVYSFAFTASDRKAATSKTVNVIVSAKNQSPQLSVPSSISGGVDSTLGFRLSAVDPEGKPVSVTLSGLRPGTFIEKDSSGIRVQYAPSASDSSFTLGVSATDGAKASEAKINVDVQKSADGKLAGVEWPGQPGTYQAPSDANGDGRTDRRTYNRVTGEWTTTACNGDVSQNIFGSTVGDFPFTYRSNHRAYEGIYRVVSGQGYWLLNIDGVFQLVPWGLARDIPVPADLDGDGTDEFVVYRPSTRQWFVRTADSQQVISSNDGNDGIAFPFAGDLDGDGRDELIVFSRLRSGEARFSSHLISGKDVVFISAVAGLSQAIFPIVGDFDGDGRADLGTYIPGGAASVFTSGSGRIEALGAQTPSASLLSVDHCDGTGSAVRTIDQRSTGSPVVTPLTALLERSYQLGRRTSADVDGDQKTNLVVWRRDYKAGTAGWIVQGGDGSNRLLASLPAEFSYQLAGSFFNQKESALTNFGDGLWVSQRRDGSIATERWGQPGDVPVAGDYNGDGITDYAVFRSSDASWWILIKGATPGTDEAHGVRWGERNDIPVPADYDGDGTTDIAVYRPREGKWYIIFADGSVRTESFGASTDIPVPGDYFGSGKAEPAIYRPQSGSWLIKRGETKAEVNEQSFGFSSDIPLLGDFDGDGKDELAVWRPTEAAWYLRTIGGEDRRIQFGLQNDEPLGARKTLRIF
ncbi:MAG: M12 family metallo-peptidase [Bdellovibrionota bacterium]